MRRAVLLTVVLLVGGCATSPSGSSPSGAAPSISVPATTSLAPSTSEAPTTTSSAAQEFDQELHDELMAMFERDQAQRMGESVTETDQERTDRLEEIIDEVGWPTISLVGEDGEDAAWAIAQHSDLDPAFQERALELLAAAVAAGDASPGNLAYLTDRVATGKGELQVYGTQGGCVDGEAVIGPVVDEDDLDARRAEVGLPPIADYIAELSEVCAQDQ